MFKSKKAYLHHPMTWAFLGGFILALLIIYLLNKGMIPGVNLRLFC